MAFEDKSLEELYAELSRVERERDAKGSGHPEYKIAEMMEESIRKAIQDKQLTAKPSGGDWS